MEGEPCESFALWAYVIEEPSNPPDARSVDQKVDV